MTARVRVPMPTVNGGTKTLHLPSLAALTPLPPVVKKPRRRKAVKA